MILRLLVRCLMLSLLAFALGGPAQARRLALVIGNDAYQKVVKLDRAGADAEAVARELTAAGFEVSLHRDLSNTRFAVAVSEFYDKVKKGDEVVVFYAGHGVQTERGAQLLPVDIEGDTEFVIERLSQPVNGLLDSLERLQPRTAVVIVDACRDNPLRAQGRSIGAARGLSGPNVARGQMLMFSAASRERALDSLGKDDASPNGVFTRELLARIRTPGLPFEQVARQVQDAVERLAATVRHKQRPLIVNDSIGDFAFYPGAVGASGATAAAGSGAPAGAQGAAADASQLAAAREDRFWDGVLKADTPEAYRSYLERYPKGEYAAVARAAIAKRSQEPGAVLAQNSTRSAEAVEGRPAASAAAPAVEPGGASSTPAAAVIPNLPPSASTTGTAGNAGLPMPPTPDAPAAGAGTAPAAPPASPSNVPAAPSTPSAPAPAGAASAQAAYTLPNGDRYEGEVRNNQRSGRGSYRFANGDRYEGEFVADQFMGQGAMRFANGDRYEGGFRGTAKQGQGVMVFANGDRYEGGFDANLFEGQGSLQLGSGERYTGSFHQGRKSGQGEQLFANKDRYVGPFEADKPQGRGTMTHANGDVYEGGFVQGVKQGEGRYRFANGDVYEGGFDGGLFSGKGRLTLASGDRYEGHFAGNVKDGSGTHYFAGGDRYEGPFRNGAQEGQGTHYFANGDRFVGPFVAGLRHGKGVYHFANGQSREIEYDKGVEK